MIRFCNKLVVFKKVRIVLKEEGRRQIRHIQVTSFESFTIYLFIHISFCSESPLLTIVKMYRGRSDVHLHVYLTL